MSKIMKLVDLLPPYYDDVRDAQIIASAQQYQFDAVSDALDKFQNNLYAKTADDKGLAVFEATLSITDVKGMDLESRRYNVISQLVQPQHVTADYLNELLVALNINAKLVIKGFSVQVKANTTDNNAMKRLEKLLKKLLPANMTFTTFNYGSTSTQGTLVAGGANAMAVELTSKQSEYGGT